VFCACADVSARFGGSINGRFGKANTALKRFDLVRPLRKWKGRIEGPPNSLLLEAVEPADGCDFLGALELATNLSVESRTVAEIVA